MMENKRHEEIIFADGSQQVSVNALVEFVNEAVVSYNRKHNLCIPKDDIEDISQEALENVLRYSDTYDSSKSSLKTWIFKIAHNCIADYWKDRSKREAWDTSVLQNTNNKSYDNEDEEVCFESGYNGRTSIIDNLRDDTDIESNLIRKEQFDRLNSYLAKLSPNSRFVIEETLKGMKPKEIAISLGCTPNAVSITLNRATKALKKMFDGDFPGGPADSSLTADSNKSRQCSLYNIA